MGNSLWNEAWNDKIFDKGCMSLLPVFFFMNGYHLSLLVYTFEIFSIHTLQQVSNPPEYPTRTFCHCFCSRERHNWWLRVFLDQNGLHASPSARDAGASVGPDAGACAGGLLSWTGLLGIPWKHNNTTVSQTQKHTLVLLPKYAQRSKQYKGPLKFANWSFGNY